DEPAEAAAARRGRTLDARDLALHVRQLARRLVRRLDGDAELAGDVAGAHAWPSSPSSGGYRSASSSASSVRAIVRLLMNRARSGPISESGGSIATTSRSSSRCGARAST